MTTPSHHDEFAAEQFARKLTARLSQSNHDLSYVVTERLRAARVQALSQRKRASALLGAASSESASITMGLQADGTALLGQAGSSGSDNTPVWLRRALTALPLVGLAAALTFIGIDQDSRATVDVAEVDAALLTSELPPAAFTDPGFQHFLLSTVSDTP
ncbi:MAG: DUF3619 family protein [Comamonas sp.]